MKRIKPEEISKKLSKEALYTLAKMAEENPPSQEWIDCSKILTDEQKFKIYELRGDVINERINKELDNLTDEQKLEKEIERKEWYKKASSKGFYGNMGNPENPITSKKSFINKDEEFFGINNQIKFDSSFLVHFQDMLNSLTIRVFINGKKKEIKFYEVLEFEQLTKKADYNFFEEISLNEWRGNIDFEKIDFFEEENIPELRYFSLKIDEYQFNIIATGFIKLDDFNESYRKQNKIKSIIE